MHISKPQQEISITNQSLATHCKKLNKSTFPISLKSWWKCKTFSISKLCTNGSFPFLNTFKIPFLRSALSTTSLGSTFYRKIQRSGQRKWKKKCRQKRGIATVNARRQIQNQCLKPFRIHFAANPWFKTIKDELVNKTVNRQEKSNTRTNVKSSILSGQNSIKNPVTCLALSWLL